MTTWKVPWRISMIQLDLRNRKVQWIFGWKVRHCTLMYCRKGTLSSNILLMEEIWWIVYPTIYKVLCIPGGAGFLPSTAPWVVICDRSQEKSLQICTSPITDAFVRLWNDGLVEVTVNLTSVICFRRVGWTHQQESNKNSDFLGCRTGGLISDHLPYVLQLQAKAAEVRCWFDYFSIEKAKRSVKHAWCAVWCCVFFWVVLLKPVWGKIIGFLKIGGRVWLDFLLLNMSLLLLFWA